MHIFSLPSTVILFSLSHTLINSALATPVPRQAMDSGFDQPGAYGVSAPRMATGANNLGGGVGGGVGGVTKQTVQSPQQPGPNAALPPSQAGPKAPGQVSPPALAASTKQTGLSSQSQTGLSPQSQMGTTTKTTATGTTPGALAGARPSTQQPGSPSTMGPSTSAAINPELMASRPINPALYRKRYLHLFGPGGGAAQVGKTAVVYVSEFSDAETVAQVHEYDDKTLRRHGGLPVSDMKNFFDDKEFQLGRAQVDRVKLFVVRTTPPSDVDRYETYKLYAVQPQQYIMSFGQQAQAFDIKHGDVIIGSDMELVDQAEWNTFSRSLKKPFMTS